MPWGALVEAREAGKIRFCGYSGDNEAAAFACRLPDVAVLETSVNLADQANIDQALRLAKTHDVGVIAKRPIANAAWKDLSEQQGMYQKYAADLHGAFVEDGPSTPASSGSIGRSWRCGSPSPNPA